MENENFIDDKLIEDLLKEQDSGNEIKGLEDLLSIEDVLYTIQEFDKKIERYKLMKAKRVKPIEDAIDKATDKMNYLKSIILSTLIEHKEKSISFPGVGRVTKKKGSSVWKVLDDKRIVDVLKERNKYTEIVEEKPCIRKKELDRLLDNWKTTGSLPDCVKEENKPESVSIAFEKDISVPRKEKNEESDDVTEVLSSEQHYDTLE